MPRDAKKIGRWETQKLLGKGGQGEVWLVKDSAGSVGAAKLLKNSKNRIANRRFSREIRAMHACSDIHGVLPILDSHLPSSEGGADRAWLVMPLAKPMPKIIENEPSLERSIEICLSISEALSVMHTRGYCHRDIKPDNILLLNEKWHIGDFGLADIPDSDRITTDERRLGPLHYIAPEMLNSPTDSDGFKADVYSLGKLMWKLASGARHPLPGHHLRSVPEWTISKFAPARTGSERLDILLESMTHPAPDARPDVEDVRRELEAWLKPIPGTQHALDLKALGAQAKSLTENRRRIQEQRQVSEKKTEDLIASMFGLLAPHFDEIENALKGAGFDNVFRIDHHRDVSEFFRALFPDTPPPSARESTDFQQTIGVIVDSGTVYGELKTGLNIRVSRDVMTGNYDISKPVVFACGHISTFSIKYTGSTTKQQFIDGALKGDFHLGQPSELIETAAIGSALKQTFQPALAELVTRLQKARETSPPIAVYTVNFNGNEYELLIRTQRHLHGLSAARLYSERNAGPKFDSDAQYLQHVLEGWLKGRTFEQAIREHNESDRAHPVASEHEVLQATTDRALESYAERFA